jgi:hypothetical protein
LGWRHGEKNKGADDVGYAHSKKGVDGLPT